MYLHDHFKKYIIYRV